MAPYSHPYVLDIRSFHLAPWRFIYSVGRVGGEKRCSTRTYATFEEARQAAQAEMNELIAAWKGENAQACPEAEAPEPVANFGGSRLVRHTRRVCRGLSQSFST